MSPSKDSALPMSREKADRLLAVTATKHRDRQISNFILDPIEGMGVSVSLPLAYED